MYMQHIREHDLMVALMTDADMPCGMPTIKPTIFSPQILLITSIQ